MKNPIAENNFGAVLNRDNRAFLVTLDRLDLPTINCYAPTSAPAARA